MKKARYHNIPCWYESATRDLFGRNWFYDVLVDINKWLDVYIFEVEELEIKIEGE